MANLVGVTFVFNEDCCLLKLPRSANFTEVRKAWAAEAKLSEDSHLFRVHSFDGPILPSQGSASQLLSSKENFAFTIYVTKRELSLREVARQQAEFQPELQPVAEKNTQTKYVEIYPQNLLCPTYSLAEFGESCCNDITPRFCPSNYDDTLLIACFVGVPYPLLTTMIEKNDANPHVIALNGASALHYAAHGGHERLARILIWEGVEIDARDKHLATPLLLAARAGRFKMVRLLLDADADIEARDKAGMSPLMYAALNGHSDVLEWLLQYGADVNAVADNNWTPLMRACIGGHSDCVRQLLEKGSNIGWCVRDNTALSLAAAGGNLTCVKLLVATGVDMVTQRIRDALRTGADRGHRMVTRYLWPIFNEMSLNDQIMSGMEEEEGTRHIYVGKDPFEGKRRYKKATKSKVIRSTDTSTGIVPKKAAESETRPSAAKTGSEQSPRQA